jgi:hypothetical protein
MKNVSLIRIVSPHCNLQHDLIVHSLLCVSLPSFVTMVSSTFDVVLFHDQILSAWKSPNVGVARLVCFWAPFPYIPQ